MVDGTCWLDLVAVAVSVQLDHLPDGEGFSINDNDSGGFCVITDAARERGNLFATGVSSHSKAYFSLSCLV